MTSRQREILSAMTPGKWMSATSVAARCTATQRGAIQRLWILEDSGYVERRGNEFALTRKGAELARALPAPQQKAEKPRAVPQPRLARIVRTGKPAPGKKRKKAKRIKRQSFSQKYKDPDGKRYGELFMIVRLLSCWLCDEGYNGPGHKVGDCAIGAQGGHTAHHVGRYDEDGMIPGGGKAHDLYAGIGGSETVAHFRGWLGSKRVTLKQVGLEYVEKAKRIKEAGGFKDTDLAW